MSVTFVPLGDRILVAQAEAEEKTPGGLIMPDATRDHERPRKGEVLAVGPGKMLLSGQRAVPEVAPGDVVHYRRHAGERLVADGREYVVLSEDEVLCKESR